MIGNAREVNNFKPKWCIEKIKRVQLEFELKNEKKPKIAILGLAFKPNIDDLRESPSLFIAKEIYKQSRYCYIVEPNIKSHHFFKLTELNKAIEFSDIIVTLVRHDEFKSLLLKKDQLLIDFCGL